MPAGRDQNHPGLRPGLDALRVRARCDLHHVALRGVGVSRGGGDRKRSEDLGDFGVVSNQN